jgi:hypothetical protein
MRPVQQRYADRAVRGSASPTSARAPEMLSRNDFLVTPVGIAAAAFSFLRVPQPDQGLAQADPLTWSTPQAEYLSPDLVLMQPGPMMTITWNRVVIYPTTDPNPGIGFYYVFRTLDEPPQQRIRVGRVPDPQDIVRAEMYVVDFRA